MTYTVEAVVYLVAGLVSAYGGVRFVRAQRQRSRR